MQSEDTHVKSHSKQFNQWGKYQTIWRHTCKMQPVWKIEQHQSICICNMWNQMVILAQSTDLPSIFVVTIVLTDGSPLWSHTSHLTRLNVKWTNGLTIDYTLSSTIYQYSSHWSIFWCREIYFLWWTYPWKVFNENIKKINVLLTLITSIEIGLIMIPYSIQLLLISPKLWSKRKKAVLWISV